VYLCTGRSGSARALTGGRDLVAERELAANFLGCALLVALLVAFFTGAFFDGAAEAAAAAEPPDAPERFVPPA